MTYEILKGIPREEKRRKYPFDKMEIGDAVFIPDWPKNKSGDFMSTSAYSKRGFKLAGKKMTRDGVVGYMIWRVE